MLIWRVEVEGTNEGPWTAASLKHHDPTWHGYVSRFTFQPDPETGRHFPTLADDVGSYSYKVAGARSYEQLQFWFPDETLRVLLDNNHRVVVYDVPDHDVLVGEYQVGFKPHQHKEVVSWTDLSQVQPNLQALYSGSQASPQLELAW